MSKVLFYNIGLLCTPLGKEARCGEAQGQIERTENCAVLCEDGKFVRVIKNGEPMPKADEMIDCGGKVATPGLVDCHTHAVFGGWRQHELALKLKGATYLEILNAGGGILSTVEKTRAASKDELLERTLEWLGEMLRGGVTAVEIKSGYGLDLENELKQLEVIAEAEEKTPQIIKSTFLAAHAVPPEYKGRADEYISLICEEMIPVVACNELAQFCDVFCEASVFDSEQSRKVLETGKKYGLIPKIHADEIERIGGAQLAGECGAISAEHLAVTDAEGMEALAKGGVVAALLPATSLYLKKGYADARAMIAHNVPVAIGSDFNPGSCPCLSLQLGVNLGALYMNMTPEELLCAVTLNAACAIGEGENIGSVETGKKADLVLWNASDWETVCYRFGSNLVDSVYINAQKVV